jgi:hypothetical protein
MKLTYNDICYIISETTKRIVAESYNDRETKEIDIEFADLNIDTAFDDELEEFIDSQEEYPTVHLVCTFDYNAESRGDYWTPSSSESYTLYDVEDMGNENLKEGLSPEAYEAVIEAAKDYVYQNSEDFEMDMLKNTQEYRQYLEDEYYDSKSDDYRMNKLGN